MMKKNVKHILFILLIVGFIALALGSAEGNSSYYDSPYDSGSSSGSSGGGSASSQSTYLVTIYYQYYYDAQDRSRYENKTFPYNIKASSEQAAIDEAVYKFTKDFPYPKYSITSYGAVKLY